MGGNVRTWSSSSTKKVTLEKGRILLNEKLCWSKGWVFFLTFMSNRMARSFLKTTGLWVRSTATTLTRKKLKENDSLLNWRTIKIHLIFDISYGSCHNSTEGNFWLSNFLWFLSWLNCSNWAINPLFCQICEVYHQELLARILTQWMVACNQQRKACEGRNWYENINLDDWHCCQVSQ